MISTDSALTRDAFTISTDSARFDMAVIHGFLTRSYWAQGIDEPTVRRALENSLCFGVFHGERQIGFARVVTDRATFAYLADVFIIDEFRSRGLAKWLMEVISAHADLQHLRRWLLATRDAHELYRQYGFAALSSPARFMERYDANAYQPAPAGTEAQERSEIGLTGESR
ncbi:MAG: GNAT family N-acetyltransferase [Collimonas pratensis]|uniref:GNAT family N-acetyltransferase n=1 Tax=Collimonas pratensis TaxID=279113 RepID=UPI003C7113C2